MHYSARRSCRLAITLAAVCHFPVLALAGHTQDQPAATPAPAAEVAKPGNLSDAADLEAFFDSVLRLQMETRRIAGAVVSVVVGDRLVFAKGYGYADVDGRRKVDPDKTMFSIASITKLLRGRR
jgi:CubicO group peptidase (beta-lactamase class C family)